MRASGVGMGMAAVVVVAAIVAGVWAVGGPETARLERLDAERRSDLGRIQSALRREDPLPASLEALGERLSGDERADPATGEPYGYRALSDSTYELCATFALGSDRLGSPRGAIGRYEAGRHCFEVGPEER